jgi:hypothetical protein
MNIAIRASIWVVAWLAIHGAAYSQISSNKTSITTVRTFRENSPVVQRIEQTLQEPLHKPGLKFVDHPLNDVVQALADEYQIPVLLDLTALDTIGIRSDEPVTIKLHGISFRSALRHMLRNLNLTYVIKDEVLLVTTPEEADQYSLLSIYDVRDVVDAEHGRSLEELVKVLSTVVGDGLSIHGLKPGTLIVAAPQPLHEEFRELLTAIRDANREPPTKSGRPDAR